MAFVCFISCPQLLTAQFYRAGFKLSVYTVPRFPSGILGHDPLEVLGMSGSYNVIKSREKGKSLGAFTVNDFHTLLLECTGQNV